MLYKIHKSFILVLLITFMGVAVVLFSPQSVSASHAQCNDGTQVPESLTDPSTAGQFCAQRAGLASGNPILLCANGNSSNTVQGCANQGSTHVTSASIASTCRSESTQEARANCITAQGGATGEAGNRAADCNSANLDKTNCGIIDYIVDFTRILSGLVGIVIVIMITIGGIQYAAAGPDPNAVVAARKRIINAVIALVFYIFMFAFLQWLVPGGIF